MEFSIKSGSPEKQRVACVIVGVYESRKLSFAADLLDRSAHGFLSEVIRRGDMEGTLGSTLILHSVPHVLCDRILLVGLGKEKEFRARSYRQALTAATKALMNTNSAEAVNYLTELPLKRYDTEWMIEQAVMAMHEVLYRFDRFKHQPEKPKHNNEPRKITLAVSRRSDLPDGERGLQSGLAIAKAIALTKDLGNLPSNLCTPTYLASEAEKLASIPNVSAQILLPDEIRDIGMQAFLSVAKGSAEEPRFIILNYQGAKNKESKPFVLVGKGITFDSGGISIKPSENMDEMKYDMLGAATVIGTLQAVAYMQLEINLIALIPACENMPSACANKPGDIVCSLSGTHIEILNTDAEGRLILCDALTYAEKFDPEAIIDVATLTGACIIALGHVATGLYSNQENLAKELFAAGEESDDRAWVMPLWDEYQEQIKSPFADLANTGGRTAGSITAACFLSHFTKKYPWAHLDIAGTGWKSGKEKGATGRPVPLLVQFLRDRADLNSGQAIRRGRPRRDNHDQQEHDSD